MSKAILIFTDRSDGLVDVKIQYHPHPESREEASAAQRLAEHYFKHFRNLAEKELLEGTTNVQP